MNAATVNAASGLGRDDLGRIVPGAKADFCTVDVTGFLVGVGALPPEPLNNLLYANGLSVRHVVTDGNFQVMNGRLIVDDEERVARRGGAVIERLWKELDAEDWFTPEPSHDPNWPHSWKAINVRRVADTSKEIAPARDASSHDPATRPSLPRLSSSSASARNRGLSIFPTWVRGSDSRMMNRFGTL